jgi:hypothetical protein
MESRNFKTASGIFGFVASVLFVVYLFQVTHGLITSVLYTSFALLAYALASYLILGKAVNRITKAIPFIYLGAGLALIYVVVSLAGGSNTFLYLALTTGGIAAISYFYATYSSSYGRSTRKLSLKTH